MSSGGINTVNTSIPAVNFIVNIVIAIINFFILLFTLFVQALRLLWVILTNFHWVFLLIALWFFGSYWLPHHATTTESVELIWRCTLFPIWEDTIRPLLAVLVEGFNDLICWWNALGQLNRLFTNKILFRTLRQCSNGADILNLIRLALNSLLILISKTLTWLFLGNFLEATFPAQPFLFSLCDIIVEIADLLTCLCHDLRPLFEWLKRIFTSENLKCAFHQFLNAIVSFFQLAVLFIIDVIRLIFAVLFAGGGLDDVRDAIAGDGDGDTIIPTLVVPLERISAGAVYMGEFFDDVLQISICTVVSEIDSGGNETLIEDLYFQCLNDTTTRVDVFCVVGPIVGAITRGGRLVLELIFNIGRIGREFFTLPDGPRFLTDDWTTDIFFDTFRDPPVEFNYTEFLINPPPIPGSNISSIAQPNPVLYGNYTIPIDITCNSTNTSITIIPCTECDRVQDISMEDCLCSTAKDLDAVVEPLIGFNLFGGVLCCLLGKTIRVIVSFAKLILEFITHIIVVDRLPEFLTNQNNWEIPITEIVGRPDAVGGLLGCCRVLLDDLDERLKCVCEIGVLLLKVIFEILRHVVIAVVRLLNDVFSTGEPGFFEYVCVSTENCMDLEVTVYSYLRRPRVKSNFTVTLDYVPIDPTITEPAWIDCFCEFFNFAFINQFLPDPLEPLPDIWCGVDFFLRALIEFVNFIVGFILAVLETFYTVFNPERPFTFVFIEYLACESETLCSPIAELISDLEDFVQCPCEFIQAIDDLIDPAQIDIPCICDLFNGIALGAVELLRALATGATAIIKLLDCLGTGFPEPECGDDLADRFEDFFRLLILAIDTVSLTFGGLGCIIGNIFQFDCLGTRFFIPPDYPTCTGGSGPAVCAPSDRLTKVFVDLFKLVATIIKFPINIVANLIALAFDIFGVADLPTSFSEMLKDFLLAIGEPLFGNEDAEPEPTSGLFQSVGLLLNCIFGPPSEECEAELDPSNGECFGDIFYVVGINIRKIYTALVEFITSFIGIIEALFGAPSTLGEKILNFITSFFDLLAVIVGSIQDIIDIVISVIVSVIRFIFGDGVGDLFEFVLDVLSSIASVIISLVDFLIGFFQIFLKRNINDLGERFKTAAGEDLKRDAHSIKITLDDLPEETLKTFPGLTNENITSLTDSETMLSLMTKGTFCYKVMYTLKDKNSFEEMNLYEEALWKGCYVLYAFPILFNSMDSLPFRMPLDYGYNTDTWLSTTRDIIKTLKFYHEWRTQRPANLSTIFVDIEPVDDINTDPQQQPPINDNNEDNNKKRVNMNDVSDSIKQAKYVSTTISEEDNININTPIINGECPIIHHHETFKDFLHSKGVNCELAEGIIDSYEAMEKRQMERNYLKMSSLVQYGSGLLHRRQQQPSSSSSSSSSTPINDDIRGERKRSYLSVLGLKKQILNENSGKYYESTTTEELDQSMDQFDTSLNKLKKRLIKASDDLPTNWQDRLYNYRTKVIYETFTHTVKRFATTANIIPTDDIDVNNNTNNGEPGKKRRRVGTENILLRQRYAHLFKKKHVYTNIQDKYGHILKGKSLLGHRFWMIGQAFKNIWKEHQENFSYNLWNNFDKKYASYIRKKHREAFENGNIPSLSKAYRVYHELRKTSYIMERALPQPSHYIHSILSGSVYDQTFTPRTTYQDETYNNNKNISTIDDMTNLVSIAVHRPPLLDICISPSDQLTCSGCASCKNGACAGCTSCTNCTTAMDNTTTCNSCSLCTVGGENQICDNCIECANCAIDEVCIDCLILQEFITQAIDIVNFCVQISQGNDSVIKLPPENSTLIIIVPIDANNTGFSGDIFTTWMNNLMNTIFGFDVIGTIVTFVLNTNIDPFTGPVGLLLFITRLPFPYLGKCNRDIDLMCTFGIGLEEGIVIATIITLVIGIVLWLIVPQFAGIFNSVASLFCSMVLLCIWVYLIVSISWFYNPRCLSTPNSIFLNFFFPVPPLPMVPVCAGQQTLDLLDKIVLRCYDFMLDIIPGNNTFCPLCPEPLIVTDCRTLGFTGFEAHLSYLFQRYLGSFTGYLLNTGVARTLCIFVAGPATFNAIGDFLTKDFGFEGSVKDLDDCFFFVITNFIGGAVIILAGIILFIMLLPIIIGLIRWLISLFKIPPISLLLPWNVAGGSDADANVDNAYSDTGFAAALIGSNIAGGGINAIDANDFNNYLDISSSLPVDHPNYRHQQQQQHEYYQQDFEESEEEEYYINKVINSKRKGKKIETNKQQQKQINIGNKARQRQFLQRRRRRTQTAAPFINDLGDVVYQTEQQKIESPYNRRYRKQQTTVTNSIFMLVGSAFNNILDKLVPDRQQYYRQRQMKYKTY